MATPLTTDRNRNRALPLLLAGSVLLAACGGGGDDTKAEDEPKDEATPAAGDTGEDRETESDGDADGSDLPEGVAISHLPFDGEAPSGFRMITDECQAGEGDADDDGYHSPFVFAVPEDWTIRGLGSGGSGGVLGTGVDVTFTTSAGDDVTVGYDWDTRTADGQIADWDGEPWTSFDFDSQVGDDKTTIEFDEVATITIDEQEVDLFYRDPSQAPDHVSGEEYRARVAVMDLTSMSDPDAVNEYTFVVTITFPSDAADVTQDVVETIVGSLSIPTCTWDALLVQEETYRNVDLDGDGQVRSIEDSLAEMQADLEARLAEQED